MVTHSRLSPSAAVRWMTCPGSVRLTEHLPRTSSEFAAEGTCAHELAEKCLKTGTYPEDHIGITLESDGYKFTVDEEMAANVAVYVQYVRSVAVSSALNIELRVDLTWLYGEEGGGTADCVIYNAAERVLYIIDLKYGRGEVVDATSPQLRVYGIGAMRQLGVEVDKLVCVIVQPRVGHIDRAEYTHDELKAFAGELRDAAEATRQADAPLIPSEKGCRWCGVRGSCEARANFVLSVPSVFPVADVAEVKQADLWTPHTLTDSQLGAVHGKLAMIREWVTAVEEEIYTRLGDGKPVPGWKLVEGRRGSKSWKDEDAAVEMLVDQGVSEDKVYKRSVITPTQAEKLIGKTAMSRLADMVYQSDGKPTVVPEDDKRPALKSSSVFQALS